MPVGNLKRAAVPTPSALPEVPAKPATVETIPDEMACRIT